MEKPLPWSSTEETPTWTARGPVVTQDDEPHYLQATAHTVNTGELSGLYYLLKQVHRRPKVRGGMYYLHSDSTYALGRALTRKRPKANRKLVHLVRRSLQEARAKHGYKKVVLLHVRSHTDHFGNDTADKLAEAGRMAKDTTENGPQELRILHS